MGDTITFSSKYFFFCWNIVVVDVWCLFIDLFVFMPIYAIQSIDNNNDDDDKKNTI